MNKVYGLAAQRNFFLCSFLFLFLACSISAQENIVLIGEDEHYLELRGHVKQLRAGQDLQSESLDSAFVNVTNEKGATVIELFTNEKGRCMFRLPLNRKFIIHVSKPGFVPKTLDVNTKTPQGKQYNYIFNFDIDIFEEIKDLNVSVLKNPIAKIAYDLLKKQFEYDINYTAKINAALRKMYREYNLLKNMEVITQQVITDSLGNRDSVSYDKSMGLTVNTPPEEDLKQKREQSALSKIEIENMIDNYYSNIEAGQKSESEESLKQRAEIFKMITVYKENLRQIQKLEEQLGIINKVEELN